jgi:hypothetical protein
MRSLLLAAVAAAALWSLPAEAGHWTVWPSFSFGYGYGPYGGPWYGPWYGPRIGVGVHVGGPAYPPPPAAAPRPAAQGALKLYVYPAAGQSEAQTADDRYQCHVWAADESGHDPTLGAGTREEAEGYTRAFSACMEARHYVVR